MIYDNFQRPLEVNCIIVLLKNWFVETLRGAKIIKLKRHK